ncbi:helix-turn-helix transcriptional regulator [Paucibacter sp. M5-1]|uniref:helix-turn-helix transcriptional regulator n=1 Tax=Paucibacter sp. M5-1 TaxID=3015998 RepID=UPI0022B8DE47|nr:helix-turn-helix transcriptional regulator [Paucibacter sp. M5-1]MCZ7884317.1 helix-turn-helix transcriptional regulator [Paucibacter sp. M5-1]
MNQPIPSDFSELLLRLYRLSHEAPIEAFQDRSLALLKRLLPFDSSMSGSATATPAGIDIHTIHLHQTGPEMLRAYEQVKHIDDAAESVLGQPRVTRRFHARSRWGAGDKREFGDFLQRFGHENIFITASNDARTGLVQWISLYRKDPHQHCGEDERLLLAQLAPHMMQALAFNRARHLQQIGQATDGGVRAGGLADLRGVLTHGDAQFTRLIEAEWPDWSGVRLPRPLLDSFYAGEREFRGRCIALRSHVEHGMLFMRARALCLADQLSPRERLIASMVARGYTHKEIAKDLQRSPATIRNQIQSVYDKLQAGNVAMLIAELRLAA